MAIKVSKLTEILNRRHKQYGDAQISYGELNTIIELHDDTAKTDCANFNKKEWMCSIYNWSFCLKTNCKDCPSYKQRGESHV